MVMKDIIALVITFAASLVWLRINDFIAHAAGSILVPAGKLFTSAPDRFS